MEKIRFDFEFNRMTATYGSFLVYLFEICPDAKLDDVSSYYAYKGMYTTRVSVELSHDHAILMKLKYGTFIVRRPFHPDEDHKKPHNNFQYIKNRNNKTYISHKTIKNIKVYDYESDWLDNTWDKELLDNKVKKETMIEEIAKETKPNKYFNSLREILQQYITKNILD